ncbi:MAG: hemolysin III, partial [Enterobacterales bacterium]
MSTAEYTLAEEITNSVTHGLGVLFSITALALLIAYSAMNGDTSHMVASSIYGSSLIIMYSASTLYHSIFHVKAK